MTETIPQPQIYAAIIGVMDDVTGVAKKGTGPKNQGSYEYRKLDDAVDAIGASFRKHAVMLQSTVKAVEYNEYETITSDNRKVVWSRCKLTMSYQLTSLVDGSSLTFEAIGQGLDNSDKSSNKAMSGALKYMLTQALMLATGENDPDAESPQVHNQAAPPARAAAPASNAPARPNPPAQSASSQEEQAEANATAALSEAARRYVRGQQQGELPDFTDEQKQQAQKAADAGRNAGNRHEMNRVIVYAHNQGILNAPLPDGRVLGSQLTALRGTL